MSPGLRVVIIADSRHPICEPFAGGLESLTWQLVDGMRRRGNDVSFFAAKGSDPNLRATQLTVSTVAVSPCAQHDSSMPELSWLEQHHAYLQLMLALSKREDIDVIHNNSLHYLPVAMADILRVPMVTTLHTPPTPWLESAISLGDHARNRFAAVSAHTANAWRHAAQSTVIPNGVATDCWREGPGGDDLVWFGRIVPEKAPHLAIDIARASGRRLRLAGPIADRDYWQTQILPRLDERTRYLGHLDTATLVDIVGHSAVALVTPVWDEPYGLVAAEALACGTPVLGFDRGGLSEFVRPDCGRLVPAGDTAAATGLIDSVSALDRATIRAHAVEHCSINRMLDRYSDLYEQIHVQQAA